MQKNNIIAISWAKRIVIYILSIDWYPQHTFHYLLSPINIYPYSLKQATSSQPRILNSSHQTFCIEHYIQSRLDWNSTHAQRQLVSIRSYILCVCYITYFIVLISLINMQLQGISTCNTDCFHIANKRVLIEIEMRINI